MTPSILVAPPPAANRVWRPPLVLEIKTLIPSGGASFGVLFCCRLTLGVQVWTVHESRKNMSTRVPLHAAALPLNH